MPQSPQHGDDSARKAPSAPAQALAYLRTKSRSEADLRAHLQGLGHAAADIDAAISAMEGYGYVHDGRLADSVAAAAARRGKGPAWVQKQLADRQVAAPAAALAVAQARAEADQAAYAVLVRRARQLGPLAEPRSRAKAVRLLLSRGYSFASAKAACAQLCREQARPDALHGQQSELPHDFDGLDD